MQINGKEEKKGKKKKKIVAEVVLVVVEEEEVRQVVKGSLLQFLAQFVAKDSHASMQTNTKLPRNICF